MRSSSVPRLILRRFISTTGGRHPCFAAPPPPTASSATGEIPLGQGQREREASGKNRRGLLWWSAVSLGVGSVVGLGYGYDKIRRMKTLVANENDETQLILKDVPAHKPSRSVDFLQV